MEQARRALATAVGDLQPISGVPAAPPVPAVAAQPVDALEREALRDHPAALASLAQLRQAQASQRQAERSGYPDIGADASYGIRARDGQGAPNWQASVSATWPIFTGFSLTHQREAARLAAEAAAETLSNQEQQLLLAVDRADLAIAGTRETLLASQAALASARENLQQAAGRYQGGVGSIIEVSEAQALVAQSRADAARALTAYHQAIADLQRAIGTTGVTP
jgi:outer membrane protein TolC